MKYLIGFVIFFVVGCAGVRLSEAQAAQLSQAREDVFAARLTSDLDARSALFQSVGSRVLAGLNDVELPPPATPAAQLVSPDGQPYTAAILAENSASKAAEETPPSGWGKAALGVAGGLALTALSVLRFSPGAFGVVAELAHSILAPKATKEMREVQKQATVVAQQAVQYGYEMTEVAKAAGLGPTVLRLQEKAVQIQEDLGIRDQVKVILAKTKADGSKPMDDHA